MRVLLKKKSTHHIVLRKQTLDLNIVVALI